MLFSRKNAILLFIITLSVVVLITYTHAHNEWSVQNYNLEKQSREENKRKLLAFTERDVVFNPGKRVSIVVYEDTDCEFCKKYAETLEKLLSTKSDEVSLTFRYRFLPIYPHSRDEGLYLECVKTLAPTKYEDFKHTLFEIPSSKNLDLELLSKEAEAHVTKNDLQSCLADEATLERISGIEGEGHLLGVTTVPRTFIISEGTPVISLVGTQSQGTLETIIDTLTK